MLTDTRFMKRLATTVVAGIVLPACQADGPPLAIDELAVTPPLPGSGMSAAYFRLTNTGREPLVIDRVRSPDYGTVEMHETRIVDGVSRMRRLDRLPLAPGETVVFERGGRHLMMQAPTGEPGRITLEFWAGDDLLLTVSAPVGRRG